MTELFPNLMIVTDDNFVFLDVTEKAKEIFQSGLFDLYIIHYDNSESLVEKYADINDAQESGLSIVIEVGQL
jgi:hypothetical protein